MGAKIIMIIQSLQQVAHLWPTLDCNTLVLLDVDDTLIIPKAGMFRHHSGHHRFIDVMKQHPTDIQRFRAIHARWRAARKTILIDPDWPHIIRRLIDVQKVTVYGFTQVNTGPYEEVPSVEQWRIDELAGKNIHFTPMLAKNSKLRLLENSEGYACFDQGILFTGPFTKSQLLEACLKKLVRKPETIVFFDDLAAHIEAIGVLAQDMNINYHGYQYQGAAHVMGNTDPKIIAYQQQKLLNDMIWLEDDEAARQLEDTK